MRQCPRFMETNNNIILRDHSLNAMWRAYRRTTRRTSVDPRIYIGQFLDDATNLDYLNARYYDSARGQFVQQDAVFWEVGVTQDGRNAMFNPQLLNSYGYAGDNPITQKDPSGRCPVCVIPVAIGLGAAGGLAQQGLTDVVANYSANGLNVRNYEWSSARDYAYSAASGAVIGAAISTGGVLGVGAFGTAAIAGGATAGSDIVRSVYVDKTPIDPYAIAFDSAANALTAGLLGAAPKIVGRKPQLFTQAFFTGSHTANEAGKTAMGAVSGGVSMGVYSGGQRSPAISPVVSSPSSRATSQIIGLYQQLVSTLTAYRNALSSR
jgi:RHS repeat-associated protein